MEDSLSKKVSLQNDTITAAIFAFLLTCACTEYISKYALTWKICQYEFLSILSKVSCLFLTRFSKY